jgi:hypothetical protein
VTAKAGERRSSRRRWLAVIVATILMVLSYVMFIYALVAASGDEVTFAGGLLGIALGLVPAVFATAAFVSNNERALLSTFGATGLWLILTLTLGLGSLPVGLVAGYGAGGVIAFRLGPSHTRSSRTFAVALCAVYTLVLQRLLPEVGLFAGAPLPFAAIVAADIYREKFFADGDAPE